MNQLNILKKEEAEELLVGMDEDVNTWSKDASDTSALNNLMRYLMLLIV